MSGSASDGTHGLCIEEHRGGMFVLSSNKGQKQGRSPIKCWAIGFCTLEHMWWEHVQQHR